ncbi:protein C2-DOMAIN ABA-RELATED 1 isoform X2 [Beta vulgaris subsp. vulgaris]|uniref:protein C2-DOMAIN ABA-RELATED 1 isoform X2 n=1 Tax=Beta vulgaris subsp. vulgaris TaxID=3555 RepID=UPI0005400C69|nr:protein C2-DOMAIN ABA-RELATED 1 isoform X2 [Beta vulgaris subsp. vulgaris]
MVNPGMSNAIGAIRIRMKRGINLAVRDSKTSDPYIIVALGEQFVYDYDTFSPDDVMGEAEIDLRPFLNAVKSNVEGIPNGTIITQVTPNRLNSISEDSSIVFNDGEVTQNMFLRLHNVECGEVELELKWIDLPTSRVA